ncbi:MAG: AMP-dependent synthetase [Planctomycetota bacterium]|nr:MAG: AMP-dependent synthetase [Planctomycetota bacterium]
MTILKDLVDVEMSAADRALLESRLADLKSDSMREPARLWREIIDRLDRSTCSPAGYRALWDAIFDGANAGTSESRPMWLPAEQDLAEANLTRWMSEQGCQSYPQLHRWSVEQREAFWQKVIDELAIVFCEPPSAVLDESDGPAAARWLTGARLNIVESCFQNDAEQVAVISGGPGRPLRRTSYGELRHRVAQVASALRNSGFHAGDAIAVVLPMTSEAVAIYLGIVAAGCVVVSIADSFAVPQIATRLGIAKAKAVFTYEHLQRAGKRIELYRRVVESGPPRTIVLTPEGPSAAATPGSLREGDVTWSDFLDRADETPEFSPHIAAASDAINVLFSSGTTGEPKAIPWNHTTPLKCAADALLHQDVHRGDVLAWPTNLGWMMGPWLIFAALLNRATLALFEDAPSGAEFGRFVEEAEVTMLGVVPTLVASWQESGCMESCDWSRLRTFSSTGEASAAEKMFYLSSLANMRPVIEYCGGTEIGGGYITSTVVEANAPSVFTTPAMGLDFTICDEQGQESEEGELFLVPPSIGLSSELLNRDHVSTYYEGVPEDAHGRTLRRHGDYLRRLPDGSYIAGGRVDDTMNLGGIKISSAEIERVLNTLPGVYETAAVAVGNAAGGPDELVVFVVAASQANDQQSLRQAMNQQIRSQLNPLFKIARVIPVDELPRTASNKVMRRKLRAQLLEPPRAEA